MENTIPYQQAKERLRKIIKQALKEPPGILRRICGEFYQPYYHLMYLLAGQIEGGLLLELGIDKGRGVGSLAAGNRSGNIVMGLDTVYKPDADDVMALFPQIKLVYHAAQPVPLQVIEAKRKIKLLHVDTEHSYANAKSEFEAYRPYLAGGAYVLFDDLHAMDNGVMKYFRELPYPKIWSDKLHPICGYGVMVYSLKEYEAND